MCSSREHLAVAASLHFLSQSVARLVGGHILNHFYAFLVERSWLSLLLNGFDYLWTKIQACKMFTFSAAQRARRSVGVRGNVCSIFAWKIPSTGAASMTRMSKSETRLQFKYAKKKWLRIGCLESWAGTMSGRWRAPMLAETRGHEN